jgi:hypothetical protein
VTERAGPSLDGRSARFVPPLLRETQFRRFWLGQTISVFGDQVTQLALPIVAVLMLHAEPTQMGLLTAVGLLPHLPVLAAGGGLAGPGSQPPPADDPVRLRPRVRHRRDSLAFLLGFRRLSSSSRSPSCSAR